MGDTFTCLSLEQLLGWIKREEGTGRIFGIGEALFFRPAPDDPLRVKRYGRVLETPVGVAAGPHTQLSQNIVAAYLTGARYIELKTVQVLDQLDVTKPCISMEDEGYNCEWSQELRLHQSFDEYVNALLAIHILKKRFGIGESQEPGFLFNMSVGYNLEGILSDSVQKFLDSMADAGDVIEEKLERAKGIFPEASGLIVDPCVSDNITISTMHGCPPEEIEKIGRYFIEERRLNTTIKLNPTLLGPDLLREILNHDLGFDVTVPDIAFDHDLKFDAGVALIKNLLDQAEKAGVSFNLKLTNTLETSNDKKLLPENEQMVYMSGRPLHAISVNLAARLQEECNGALDISFSAGCDCFNIVDLLRCGLQPVTVCSDILKPGGYGRIGQYLESIKEALEEEQCLSVAELIDKKSSSSGEAGFLYLQEYAEKVRQQRRYRKESIPWKNIKTARELELFDCVEAPCKGTCPAGQDVPSYMFYTARGMVDEAMRAVLKTNPFPNVQGLVCDHPCTEKCTRINYDEPLKIREIKRFIATNASQETVPLPKPDNGLSAAVIGGGPSGFSAAYFLRLQGFEVDLFEARPFGGGMAADAIPSFRLDDLSLEQDIRRITELGVTVHYERHVDTEEFERIREEFDYVYIGVGASQAYRLDIPGAAGSGMYDQLEFLRGVRKEKVIFHKRSFAIIGGGNSAMDAARTARRLAGKEGKVTIVYRRTIDQMVADREELEAVMRENIEIVELATPLHIHRQRGKIVGLGCQRMRLGEPDSDGRPRPIPVTGSEFTLEVDTVVSAIGQKVVIPFLDRELEVDSKSCETTLERVYAGGDAIRGASTLVKAIGDGRKVVQSITVDAIVGNKVAAAAIESPSEAGAGPDGVEIEKRLGTRIYSVLPSQQHTKTLGFELAAVAMTQEQAMREASRCLSCDTLCNICTTVCPNRANIGYDSEPCRIITYGVRKINTKPVIEKVGIFTVTQPHQVINVGDFCNECGNCTTFCPTAGRPYIDKPKFYLSMTSLEAEDSGYMVDGSAIHKKSGGEIVSLIEKANSFDYVSTVISAEVSKKDFRVTKASYNTETTGAVDLSVIAELGYLYRALQPLLGGV